MREPGRDQESLEWVAEPGPGIGTRLLQLGVVTAIVAALVGVSVPFFQDNLSESQSSKAGQDLEVIKKAMALRQAREPFTRTTHDLSSLTGRYLQELPRDPWGNPYRFDPVTNTLRSDGADGVPGGSGGDRDVVVQVGPAGPGTWLGSLGTPAGTGQPEPLEGARGPEAPLVLPATFLPPGFLDPREVPLSTFGLDVDTASWALVRSGLRAGQLPPAEAVRAEEFLNAFEHGDPLPEEGDFGLVSSLAPARLAPGQHLLRIGIRARGIRREERPPLDLTFVVDLSGSMDGASRLGMVKRSLHLLLDCLGPRDQLALVTFSDQARVALPLTPVSQQETLRQAVESLATGGATNFEEGLRLGYEVARRSGGAGRSRRVVLCSDGGANQGIHDEEGLVSLVREAGEGGVLLTALGYGMGGSRDHLMERLADRGDGVYAYLDSEQEIRKRLVDQLLGTMFTVARDARAQVDFDPLRVRAYRRIGYRNRSLPDASFRAPDVDAGEIGVEHGVTVLYQVLLHPEAPPGPLGTVHLRWRAIEGESTHELSRPLAAEAADERSLRVLRRSEWIAGFAQALELPPAERREALAALAAGMPGVLGDWPGDEATEELAELVRRARELAQ